MVWTTSPTAMQCNAPSSAGVWRACAGESVALTVASTHLDHIQEAQVGALHSSAHYSPAGAPLKFTTERLPLVV